MVITVCRQQFDDLSTQGRFYFGNEDKLYRTSTDSMAIAYSLEDKDRQLYKYMTDAEIKSVKVPDFTAIPYGRYAIELYNSFHFKTVVPLLIGVPGFDHIEVHWGSFVKNTKGCVLGGYNWHKANTGKDNEQYWIGNSKEWFTDFMLWLNPIIRKEKCFIEITK